MIAIGSANAAPTTRPKTIPSGSELTFFENQPISTPAMRPLKVDPMTMPTIRDDTSGDETSADNPSKIPRTPPSTRPNRGLFMIAPEGLPSSTAIRGVFFRISPKTASRRERSDKRGRAGSPFGGGFRRVGLARGFL